MINISNIEKFATHDGPGIRTTIFFKGCSLHCPWCANPETWSVQSTLMHDSNTCKACHMCEQVCNEKAIHWESEFHYDVTRCIGCHTCIDSCMYDALSMAGKWMDVEEIVKDVLKDKDYYDISHGGITISGGEAFVQFEGLVELLKALKKEGLHIALETTGNYPLEKLKEVESYIDLFLFDIKHVDSNRLHEITGANPIWVQENFEYLAKNSPEKIISRTPVIPTFNEDYETIVKILKYGASLGIKEAHLLPYHPLGKNKWNQMGKVYTYDFKMMEKEELFPYIEIGKKYGIQVKIGG